MVRGMVVLVRDGEEVTRWPLLVRDGVDLALVDDLARLQLSAHRLGCTIELQDACPDLLALLDLVGLRVLASQDFSEGLPPMDEGKPAENA